MQELLCRLSGSHLLGCYVSSGSKPPVSCPQELSLKRPLVRDRGRPRRERLRMAGHGGTAVAPLAKRPMTLQSATANGPGILSDCNQPEAAEEPPKINPAAYARVVRQRAPARQARCPAPSAKTRSATRAARR